MTYYPLTAPQQNIWNLQKYYENTPIGNISGMITLKSDGITDLSPALSYAINRLIKNADALRLRFTMLDGEVKQYFADYIYEDIPVWNYSHMTEEEVLACLQAKAEIPFDLNKENSMVRFAIVKRQDSYSVFMSIHHLICDGWTANLIGNWLGIYAAQYDNQDLQTAPIPSYAEFIKSEEQYRHGNRYERDTAYWETFVKEYREPSYIKPKLPENDDIRSARYTYHLSREETTRIKAFCLENNCSPDALMKTAVAIYLNKLNHDPHIVIGTPLLNRLGTREKAMLGMCVTSLPLSIHINDEQNPQELLCQYGNDSGFLYRHIRYPLLDIQNLFRSQQKDTNKMYDILVSYEYTAINESNIADVKWFYQGCSEIPLTIHVDDRGGNNCFDVTYDYQLHLFNEKKEIELLACRIRFIIEQMLMGSTVGKISILPCDEKQLLQFFNNTSVLYPKEKCLHELFEKTVAENANTTAVVFENHSYTYAELNQMANSIAYELRRLGVTRNDIVPIIARRSHLVLAAQFGVIKAGGAYLPIDPDYPQDRIDYMLDNAKCKVALIYQAPNPIEIDSVIDLENLSINENLSNPKNINNPSDLCYVIYTSGSTGRPKGTMLSHQNVVNYCHSNCHNVHGKVIDDEISRIVSVTTIGFDIYVTESLLALLNGMTVYFANDAESKLQNQLSVLIEQNQIDVIQTTPAKMKMLISDTQNLTYLRFLKKIILGGEPFSEALYQELKEHTSAQIYNIYGPTETTVWSSVAEVNSSDISIGTPIANTQIYILSEQNELCPIGIAGELCIAGDGVCSGYLNREELTAEKFIDNPFGCGKLYKSGDLAYYRPDGKLECLGRIDSQVKIRGLRVELGEIESNICAFDGITNTAVVIVKHDGKDFLCAFYQSTLEIDEAELKATLAKVMPNYMIPNLFIRLESFPMTSSGKIARGVLAKYDISGLTASEEYKAPETELQELLCKEYERLLKISPISINLDFFGAGGNSIHVIEMLAHLPEEFHLSAKDIYDHPTVKALAEFIETRTEKKYETISRLVKGEDKQVIVCFPFAGSDDSTFIDLASALKNQLPTVTVYALRHANWTEVDFSKAIEEVSQIIEKAESVVFYSHCAGSAMALKLYQNLPDNSKIKRIVMGGNVPPKGIKLYGKRLNPWKFMSDEKLLHTLQNVGMELDGMSEAVKAKLAKQFRIDTECYFREMALLDGVFDIPCTLIVSDADKFTPHIDKAQHAWQHYFKHPIDMVVIHGANHYFHIQRADEVANAIIGLGDLK